MNRFAALVDRLTTAADGAARHRLLADYFANAGEQDRAAAAGLLAGTLERRRVSLNLVKGLIEARTDPTLFALSRDYVGDLAETIALVWPQTRGANRDPAPAEIVEALSTMGKSELPKRIAAWLDATDANGRWLLIKLVAGGFRSPVTATEVGHALTAAGVEPDHATAEPNAEPQQGDMFSTGETPPISGAVHAMLMYVEFGRSRISPIACTFGAWRGETLLPIGKTELSPSSETWAKIEPFVSANTIARFGPVREVAHTRDAGLILEIAFGDLERTPRRKAGVALKSPRITGVMPDVATQASTLDELEHLTLNR